MSGATYRRAAKALLFAAACLLSAPASGGELYVWTDADGVRHITNGPPPPGVEGQTYKYRNPTDEEQQRAMQERQKSAEVNKARKEQEEQKRDIEAQLAQLKAKASRYRGLMNREEDSYIKRAWKRELDQVEQEIKHLEAEVH